MNDPIRYKGGYKYQLVDNVRVVLPRVDTRVRIEIPFISLRKQRLEIKRGYAWDGPSGPTADVWLPRLYRRFQRGALIHDVLYQLIRHGHLPPEFRLEADKILRELCVADGMWPVRAWWVYRGVRRGGKGSASPAAVKVVREAP